MRLTAAKLLWELTTKPYWNAPLPVTLLAGPATPHDNAIHKVALRAHLSAVLPRFGSLSKLSSSNKFKTLPSRIRSTTAAQSHYKHVSIVAEPMVTREWTTVFQGFHAVVKVLNCEIGFQGLEKVLNLGKMYI